MKGYKGMTKDMTCRGMQFMVGEKYHVDGEIEVCHNGLHFYEKLSDVFDYYQRDGNRFFIVDASGTIKTDGNESAASDMEIIRELNEIEINRVVYDDGYGDGSGNGNGYGYGYGDGDGKGNGYGYGNGYGNGNGYGDGDGNGDGSGDGYGYGSCYGNGYGDGYGNGYIQKILLFV